MRRIVYGVAATAAALALAGCASQKQVTTYEPAEWTASGALWATGGILFIPAIVLFIMCAVHYYTVDPYEEWKPLTRNLLIGGIVTCGLIAVVWIAATWAAVGS